MTSCDVGGLLQKLHLPVNLQFELRHRLLLSGIIRGQQAYPVDHARNSSPHEIIWTKERLIPGQSIAAHGRFSVVEARPRSLDGLYH